jgi:hypothetical protein
MIGAESVHVIRATDGVDKIVVIRGLAVLIRGVNLVVRTCTNELNARSTGKRRHAIAVVETTARHIESRGIASEIPPHHQRGLSRHAPNEEEKRGQGKSVESLLG